MEYTQFRAHDAHKTAEAEADHAKTAEKALDALTPVALAAESKQRVRQAVTDMQNAATGMLREVEKAEALGATADVAPLRAEHDRLQAKAAAKLKDLKEPIPVA